MIEAILSKHGPLLSSDLRVALVAKGLTNDAARKKMSRARLPVRRLPGLAFSQGQRFFYLDGQENDDQFWDALESAIRKSAPAYLGVIAGLKAKGGIAPKSVVETFAGGPRNRKRQVNLKQIFQRLSDISVIEPIDSLILGKSYALQKAISEPLDEKVVKARLMAEQIALDAVSVWLQRTSMVSHDSIRKRGDDNRVDVAQIPWDLSAPSYLSPFRRTKDGKIYPGFALLDIHMGSPVSVDQMQAFVRKAQMASAPKGVAPLLVMYLADGYSQEAFKLAKSAGIMPLTLGHIFGEDIGEAFRDLVGILTNAAATVSSSPGKFVELFDRLSKVEGATFNIRGILFELIVGHLVKRVDEGSIEIGEIFYDPKTGDAVEVDVRRTITGDSKVTLYECKGRVYPTQEDDEVVEHWIKNRVPRLFRAMRNMSAFHDSDIRFEFWTTGTLSPGSLALLKTRQAKTNKYAIGWRDGLDVLDYAKNAKSSKVVEALKEHFVGSALGKSLTPPANTPDA